MKIQIEEVLIVMVPIGIIICLALLIHEYLRRLYVRSVLGCVAEQQAKEAILEQAHQEVRYLSIVELRRALEPGRTDTEYAFYADRISVRSALIAIRKLGLAPAVIDAYSATHTPKTAGDMFIIFPGTGEYCNARGGEGWAVNVIPPDDSTYNCEMIAIGQDMYGPSLIAAVAPDSPFAGRFPAEWEKSWEKGEDAIWLVGPITEAVITI
jgi:hypothetical protein